jgi:hypothetical protein
MKGHGVSLWLIGSPPIDNYAFEPEHRYVYGGTIRMKYSFGNEN